MSVERLIKDNPQFHQYEGTVTSWAIHPDTLRFLYSMLTPGTSTLETGCGHSTVIFSIAGTKHTCITNDSGEAERVKKYCEGLGFTKNTTFIIESSDLALPRNELIPSELDIIFIDGAHRFPFPIIDWHYTAPRLKLGGILGVDDFNMASVRILYDFLCVEEEWELVRVVHNTAFFKKLREPNTTGDWQHQKINLAQSPRTIDSRKRPLLNRQILSQLINKLK